MREGSGHRMDEMSGGLYFNLGDDNGEADEAADEEDDPIKAFDPLGRLRREKK